MKPQIRKVFGKWWWSCPACYRTRSTPDWAQAQTTWDKLDELESNYE